MREENSVLNQTILYEYDLGGNILEKRIYIYQPDTTEEELELLEIQKTVTYGYEDTVWNDKMTSYDGQTITYDAIGNPLSYRGMTFTWKNARELGSVTKDGTTYQYRYNQDGMRNRKYLSDGTVYYQIEGDLIVGEQKIKTGETEPEYEMEFIYDSSGNVIALLYNGTEFYYEKNLQGDIVAIRNVFGELSVTYEYDSWGNVTAIGGLSSDRTLGELNPFRYRGYYYDSETGFYYVSSRYYDPEVGRFISADTTDVLDVQSDLYDKNLYAYCDNNPVMRVDSSGAVWHLAVGAAVGVATQFIADVGIGLASGNSLGEIMASLSPVDYISAAISGALAASGIGLAGAVAANATLGGTTYLANCSYRGEKVNVVDFAVATTVGGVSGYIGGSGVNGKNLRGIYNRSNQVLKTAKSTRKIAQYTAKKVAVKTTVKSGVKNTVKAGLFSNVANFFRKLFTKSKV